MFRPRAEAVTRAAPYGVVAAVVAAAVATVIALPRDHVNLLSVIFGLSAVGAGVLIGGESDMSVSASFIVNLLAAALLGPVSAIGTAVIAEATATVMVRTHWRRVVLINLPTVLIQALAAVVIIKSLVATPRDSAPFYLAITLAGFVSILLDYAMFAGLYRLVHPAGERYGVRTLVAFLPSATLAILLAVAGTSITLEVGYGGITFGLVGVFAFSYMAHLVQQSRKRAKQYVSLSWGVLAGLMRALDIRDQRAARHAAAVARFARDMAEAVGMSEEERELAHTAGLLHDIGRFALSDRVAERGRVLAEEDWEAIYRHPELGADMLRDLGMYGPVAEIVLAHHERIDGRGYPRKLRGEQIPEIAKIIAVAEAYDTLTAADTYRTRMNSPAALNQLRLAAGSQFDPGYVEVLASLLTGEGVEYRHADMADFDTELDMERRISRAGAGA